MSETRQPAKIFLKYAVIFLVLLCGGMRDAVWGEGENVVGADGLNLENENWGLRLLSGKGAGEINDSETADGAAVWKIVKETRQGGVYLVYKFPIYLEPGLYELDFSHKGASFSAHLDFNDKKGTPRKQKTMFQTIFTPSETLTSVKWTFKTENDGKYRLSLPIHCHDSAGEVWVGGFKVKKIEPPKAEWRYEYLSGETRGDPGRNMLKDGVIGSSLDDGLVMLSKASDVSIEITFLKPQWVKKVVVWTSRVWPTVTVNSITLEGALNSDEWQEISRDSGYKADDWGLCRNTLSTGGAFSKLKLNFKTTGILGISEIEITGKNR